jgi:hypothetical protein
VDVVPILPGTFPDNEVVAIQLAFPFIAPPGSGRLPRKASQAALVRVFSVTHPARQSLPTTKVAPNARVMAEIMLHGIFSTIPSYFPFSFNKHQPFPAAAGILGTLDLCVLGKIPSIERQFFTWFVGLQIAATVDYLAQLLRQNIYKSMVRPFCRFPR